MRKAAGDRAGLEAAFAERLAACLRGQGFGDREVDWDGIAALARRHRVAPLLFRRLERNAERNRVPAPTLEHLRRSYYLSADRNMRNYHRLRPLLVSLRGAGIPVILLKGACLGEVVYRNIALRPMGDADLLVPRTALDSARATLLNSGCNHESDTDIDSRCRFSNELDIFVFPEQASRDREPETAGKHRAMPRSQSAGLVAEGLQVGLHWTIEDPTSPFAIPTGGLWDRARPAEIAGVEGMILSPEDLLLHVCLHNAYHHGLGSGLLPMCDIACIVDRYHTDIDWARLYGRAREWGVARYIGLALLLARELLAADIPEEAVTSLVPGGPGTDLYRTARECVLAQESYRRTLPPTISRLVGAGTLPERLRVFRYRFSGRGHRLGSEHAALGRAPVLRPVLWTLAFGLLCRASWRWILRPRLSRLLNPMRDQKATLAAWLGGEDAGR